MIAQQCAANPDLLDPDLLQQVKESEATIAPKSVDPMKYANRFLQFMNLLGEPSGIKIYRQAELDRLTASLLAGSQILVTSSEGMGKSFLVQQVYEKLLRDNVRLV